MYIIYYGLHIKSIYIINGGSILHHGFSGKPKFFENRLYVQVFTLLLPIYSTIIILHVVFIRAQVRHISVLVNFREWYVTISIIIVVNIVIIVIEHSAEYYIEYN